MVCKITIATQCTSKYLEELRQGDAGETSPSGNWSSNCFRTIAVLQETEVSRVELVEEIATSRFFAIKAVSSAWACETYADFASKHPEDSKNPWLDIATNQYLSKERQLGCICEFMGIFRRQAEENSRGEEVCMVLSYCSGGDIFSMVENTLQAGGSIGSRAAAVLPMLLQILRSVEELHSEGFAHNSLSVETVLVEDCHGVGVDVRANTPVKLVGLGAVSGPFASGAGNKPWYLAPEIHAEGEYDAQAADMFAVGVISFELLLGDHPWRSSRPDVCPRFSFFTRRGLGQFLLRIPMANSWPAVAILLLHGLLQVDPQARLTAAAAASRLSLALEEAS